MAPRAGPSSGTGFKGDTEEESVAAVLQRLREGSAGADKVRFAGSVKEGGS